MPVPRRQRRFDHGSDIIVLDSQQPQPDLRNHVAVIEFDSRHARSSRRNGEITGSQHGRLLVFTLHPVRSICHGDMPSLLHQYAIISDDRHTIRDWRHRCRRQTTPPALHRSISRHSGHPVTSPSTTPPADEYHAASDGQQHDQPADRDAPVADRPCWFCRPPCWPCGTSVLSSSDSLGSVGSVGLPGSVGSVGPSLAFTVTVRSAVAVLPALSTSARTLPASPRPPNRTP